MPSRSDFGDAAINFSAVAPVYLLIAASIAISGRLFGRLIMVMACHLGTSKKTITAAKVFATCFLIICAAGTLLCYKQLIVIPAQRTGYASAKTDWANGVAYQCGVSGGEEVSGGITSFYDFKTGLRLKPMDPHSYAEGFRQSAYFEGVNHLVQTRGIPRWSVLHEFVSEAELNALLMSTQMESVKALPAQVTAGVRIRSNHTIEGGDGTRISFGGSAQPLFIGKFGKFPGRVFVRIGNKVVVVCAGQSILEYYMNN